MRNPPVLVRLAVVVVLCVLAGVCLAGLAFPVIGGIALASKTAADQFKPEKPPELGLPLTTKILASDGSLIASLYTENRIPITLSQVPKVAQDALVAIEDSRFYEHRGIDVKGTLRALLHNSSSGSTQGGSTLTQQYVKNLLIETADSAEQQKAAVKRSIDRKLQEARYAVYIEQHSTKQEILEDYFNIAYYNSGVYGIGAAARHYFNRHVELLTVGQSAMLAGMVQNPSKYDPSTAAGRKNAVKRRDVVLDRMVDLGYLTAAQKRKAISEPLGISIQKTRSGCAQAVQARFFCDYVRRYLVDGAAGAFLGKTSEERMGRLLSGGLTIKTTLDPRIQRAADQAVRDKVPPTDPSHVIAVADTVEPGTGAVKAMGVNREFGVAKGQVSTNYAIGGTSGYQGGSTFKAFVLARALQMGIEPSLTLFAPKRYCSKKLRNAGKDYCVSNAGDSESGTFDLVKATWESVNTYFIQLEERTGVAEPLSLAESLGVRDMDGTFDGDDIEHNASFVLGSAGPHGYSPLAMAGAYATFAASGTYCPVHPITSITDSAGQEKYKAPTCVQAIEPDIADKVTSILRDVVTGTSSHTGGGASIGRPVAGKTGTTNDEKAAWFIGYTPQLATAVWMGLSTPTSMGPGFRVNVYHGPIFGGTVAAPIFADLMTQALDGVSVASMPAQLGGVGHASPQNLVDVPSVLGLRAADAKVLLEGKGFTVVIGPAVNAAPIPANAIAAQSASGKAPAGSTITITPSTGLAPTTPTKPTNPPPTGKPKPTHNPKPTKTSNPPASPTP